MSITLLSCQDKVSCPRTGDSNPGQHMNLGLLNPENQVLFHNRQVHRYDWMSTQKQATKQLLVFFLKQHLKRECPLRPIGTWHMMKNRISSYFVHS